MVLNVFWDLPNRGVADSNTTENMDTLSRISALRHPEYVEKFQCHDQTFRQSKNVDILHRTAVITQVKRKFECSFSVV
jgi:hypothetical protein